MAAPSPVLATTGVVQRFFDCALLGMVASGYFAVLGSGQLDGPTAVVALAALCLRALAIANLVALEIPPKAVAALTLAYVVFYAADYFFLSKSFLTATVRMIFFVAVVKLLTAKTPRDYTFLKVIAALELLAAAILSTHISFFGFLAAFLLCTVATLASGEVLRSLRVLRSASGAGRSVSRATMRGFPRRLAVLACALFCGILLMTAGLFFVLPRTARAAFQRLAPSRYHLPGFSSEVTLGQIGVIKQSSAPVMHITSRQGEGLLAVRWRGAVLTQFDGQRWFNPPATPERLRVYNGALALPLPAHARPGRGIRYEVRLEEIASDTLFFAGTPQNIFIQTVFLLRSPYGSFSVLPLSAGGLRYSAYSFLEDESTAAGRVLPPLPESERSALLALPALDRRIYELAREWTKSIPASHEQARAIERHLRTEYGYSLELLSSPVPDPLSYFLFTRRKGHCEYFASAMAVMLRTLGIPSRVVTGFLSGAYNPITQRQVVRASDAHSWVEAWIPDRGWTTFDPTPPDPSASSGGLRMQLALFFDAVDQFWRDWIVGYDFDQQLALASRVKAGGRRMRLPAIADAARWLQSGASAGRRWLAAVAAAGALGLLGLFYGPSWWRWLTGQFRLHHARRGAAHPSDATLLYQHMLALLEKRGFQKPPWLTPAEFARALPASELALLVDDLTRAYNEVRFGGRPEAAPRMARLLQRIETLCSAG